MSVTAGKHAETGDKFESYVVHEPTPYAVVKISNPMNAEQLTIFTPHGLNWTRDYLIELRDAIQGSIDELTQMDKRKEA